MNSLAYRELSSGSDPQRWFVFVHGILGTKSNWVGIARRFVEARPEWGALLVDLPGHGQSPPLTFPYTVTHVAEELCAFIQKADFPVEAILGHSFGGKVALECAQVLPSLDSVWVIDSLIGIRAQGDRHSQVQKVVDALKSGSQIYTDRLSFSAHLETQGINTGTAKWLAMNLRKQGDGRVVFGPDLSIVQALINDYSQFDLWPVLENPLSNVAIHVVVGESSDTNSAQDLKHLRELADEHSNVDFMAISGAGHWVHVDAAEALLKHMIDLMS